MKYIFTLSVVFLLGACSVLNNMGQTTQATTPQTPATTAASASNIVKLRTCSLEQAVAKIQDGSAFTGTLTDNAEEIAGTCLKKLALESAGLDTQANQDATNALQSLMNAVQK